MGTDDTGATDHDPTGGGAPGNNMVQVTGNIYDNGLAGGDNSLTQTTQFVDSSTARVTTFLYDSRDRQTDIDGEVDFYQKVYYDNLDRVLHTERYDTTLSASSWRAVITLRRSKPRLPDHSLCGRSTTGFVGNALTDNTWFDASAMC